MQTATRTTLRTLRLFALPALAQTSPSTNLALTPPMGWNSWNKFACNVSDELIRGMADALVKVRHERRGLSIRGHR